MNRSVSLSLIIGIGFLLLSLVLAKPEYLGDQNNFLKDFVGSNLLNVLGVILTITLASIAQLHLELNKIEERHNKSSFKSTRTLMKGVVWTLIALFLLAIVTLVTKAIMANSAEKQAIFNSIALYIVFLDIIALIDISTAAFSIKAKFTDSLDLPHQAKGPLGTQGRKPPAP